MTSVAIDGDEIPATGEIRMLPDNNRVEFRFAAPTTVGARLIRYRYRLEGFDSRWNEIVGARVATYTRVPPGHYRFVVSASNASGLWSQTPAIVMLRVLPPFWRTWWFIGLTCAAAISALAFAYRLRIRTIERKQAAQAEFSRQLLTQQEEERKRVASELHDSLGQSLLIIRNRALLAIDRQVASDEELTEISETASAAIDEVRRIAHHLRPVELDHLGLRGSLVALVRRLSASTTILFRGDFDDVDEVLQSDAQVNLFRIVQEWTSNIVRHSDATAAFISLERDGRRLRMRITDDGSGFSYVDGARRARTGIGLRSIEERVQMLKGTLDIQSTPGEGTALTIEWSLPEAE
jgi:signal transduction histidine kinase